MIERCKHCGRLRPGYIYDPHCPKASAASAHVYCAWTSDLSPDTHRPRVPDAPIAVPLHRYQCSGSPLFPDCGEVLDCSWLDGMRMSLRDGWAGLTSVVYERTDGSIVRVMLHDVTWAVTHAMCARCASSDLEATL
jgi:hypothetical protein